MTIADEMKLVLAGAVSDVSGLGETWSYRNRSSNRDAASTYGAWASVAAVPTDRRLEYEDETSRDMLNETIFVRVASTVTINIGDQMRDPSLDIWHVDDQTSSGYGTNKFLLSSTRKDLLGSIRDGGL